MRKLGRRKYIMEIADVLVKNYGSTLKEYGTDVGMAKAVVRSLKDVLCFCPQDTSKKEFDEWAYKRDPTNIEDCFRCGEKYYAREKHVCKK